jgi:4-hydroxy-tetrahydrodipicolinate reductase
MTKIRVLHVGLGPIGQAIAKQIAGRAGFTIAGAVDVDPAIVGRDLGGVIGLPRRLRVPVQDRLRAAINAARPDIVVHCTGSSLEAVAPQLTMILATYTPVISTTEELAYPWRASPRLARAIDAAAKRAKVAVLATGVNPGFAMDALPLAITAVCERVDRIRVRRVQDARIRRVPFQRKIGAGLALDEFRERVAQGTVRHVGFAQSIAMIADALGWRLDRVTEEVKPKIARTAVASSRVKVKAGQVAGIIQDGVGYRRGEPLIALHLEAYLGAPESYDSVDVDGSPKLSMKFTGGIHGDIATASMVVNAIPNVIAAAPGLRTMRDLQGLRWHTGIG